MKFIKLDSRGFEHVIALALVLVSTAIIGTYFIVASHAASNSIDVSFPQCGQSLGWGNTGIIGVNGGGDFEQNPCLRQEAQHFSQYDLYVNTNYPSSGCPQPLSLKSSAIGASAFNCGYANGKYDVDYAASQHVNASRWWIDVEKGRNIPWSTHKLNISFLQGLQAGLAFQSRQAITIGYYSTKPQWSSITGGWRNGNLVWYATGQKAIASSAKLKSYCSKSFTGGPVYMWQYIQNGLDVDIRC